MIAFAADKIAVAVTRCQNWSYSLCSPCLRGESCAVELQTGPFGPFSGEAPDGRQAGFLLQGIKKVAHPTEACASSAPQGRPELLPFPHALRAAPGPFSPPTIAARCGGPAWPPFGGELISGQRVKSARPFFEFRRAGGDRDENARQSSFAGHNPVCCPSKATQKTPRPRYPHTF